MTAFLEKLFPEDDYRFQLRFERGDAAEFFGPTVHRAALISERHRWLRSETQTYAAMLPSGEPLLEEVTQCARTWHGFVPAGSDEPDATLKRCLELGEFWEADYLLLQADAAGAIRLFGGCLCFPSSWRLTDKMGQTLEFIHGPVPGLNLALGQGIHRFLMGLKPGMASLRFNWGLARSPELNHHPDRKLRRLDMDTPVEEVWLRVEHQALVALPRTGGILFGIRVTSHPFSEIRAHPTLRPRLRRALATMSEAMAHYKGLSTLRSQLVDWLAD